jgi:membrane-associated phospholipid phosphatase
MAPSDRTGLDLRPGPFLKAAASRLDTASRRGFPVTVAWLLSALFFLGFLSIAEEVVEPFTLLLDRAATAFNAAVASPAATRVMWVATLLGDVRVAVVVTAVAAILLAVWGHPRRAGSVVVLMLVSVGLSQSLKYLVERPRPPAALALIALPTSPSFPSGHAMAGMVLAGTLALMLVVSRAPRVVRVVGAIAIVFAGMLVGLSRVYLGVHYFSDVLASWLLGGTLVGLWAAAVLTWGRAFPLDPSASPLTGGKSWRWALTVAGVLIVALALASESVAMPLR